MVQTPKPTHPGELLFEDFMQEHQISKKDMSEFLGISRQYLDRILDGDARVSPEIALSLSAITGTSAQFWLNMAYNS